jgi:hypothetical protein
MPRVVFEPTISVFERPKMVHALDRAATVIGVFHPHVHIINNTYKKTNSAYFS